MKGDAIICFPSFFLYQSMIRAHLLPLLLQKDKKPVSPNFCCWSIGTREKEATPKELSQMCLVSISLEVQSFKNGFQILFLLCFVLLWLYIHIVAA